MTRLRTLWPRLWPHLVAAFVVLHVAASCIDTVPNLALALNRRNWSDPRVKRELDAWAARLGVQRGPFEQVLWDVGMGYQSARNVVEGPFRPYYRVTGVRQQWAMFIAGTRTSDRFELRGRACAVDDPACDWELLYTRGDPAHAFLADILSASRMRSEIFRWGWPTSAKSFERGCKAVAGRAFLESDQLLAVECRFGRYTLPDPGITPVPTIEYDRARVVVRAAAAP